MKIHKKMKIGIIGRCMVHFCFNCQSIVNLKLKFLGYNEKNMGFYSTPRKYYLRLSLVSYTDFIALPHPQQTVCGRQRATTFLIH